MINRNRLALLSASIVVALTALVPTRTNTLDPITIAAAIGIAAGCSWGTGYIVDRWYPELLYANNRDPYRPLVIEKVDDNTIDKDFEESFQQSEKKANQGGTFQFMKKYKIGRGPRLSFQLCGPFALPVIEIPYEREMERTISSPSPASLLPDCVSSITTVWDGSSTTTKIVQSNGDITVIKEVYSKSK